MVPTVRLGTVVIGDDWPTVANVVTLASDPHCGKWRVVRGVDSFALDRAIRAAGGNCLFMEDELKATFLGAIGTPRIQSVIKGILAKAQRQNFNCLEVTGIVAKRFLGVPCVTVSARAMNWRLAPLP